MVKSRFEYPGALPFALASMALAVSGQVSAGMLEEVVVTAQKRAESLQDVPIAVTAFSGGMLSDMGISSMQDIELVTPSLVISNTGATASPYLRGVGTRLGTGGSGAQCCHVYR